MSCNDSGIGRIWGVIILAGAFLVSIPSCTVAHEGVHEIRITRNGFAPEKIEIDAGETIIFMNEDSDAHWPASNLHPTHTLYPHSDIRNCGTEQEKEQFDSCRGIQPQERYQFTFNEPGTWRYHDHLHPQLGGEIAVRGASASAGREATALPFSKKLAAQLYTWYFTIFPAKGERALSALNVFQLADDELALEYWMRIFGYERMLGELERDSENSEGAERGQCHTEAHYIGRLAYTLFNVTPFTTMEVDDRCQFGFYHGLIEVTLGNLSDDEIVKQASAMCARFGDKAVTRMFCEHGIGHGLLVHYNYDLPKALEKCGLLTPSGAQQLCYHGAYMENAFVALKIGVAHETDWINEKQPDFPCTSPLLPQNEDVIKHCYFGQSLLWGRPFNNFNGKAVVAGCLRAPPFAQAKCFEGMGFNGGAAQAGLDDKRLAELCRAAPEQEDRYNCLVGASFARSISWRQSDDFRNPIFCEALGIDDLDHCNAYITQQLAWLFER